MVHHTAGLMAVLSGIVNHVSATPSPWNRFDGVLYARRSRKDSDGVDTTLANDICRPRGAAIFPFPVNTSLFGDQYLLHCNRIHGSFPSAVLDGAYRLAQRQFQQRSHVV